MKGSSQNRAVESYRARLAEKGLVRFEVIGLRSDRDLVRSIARRLTRRDQDAARLRKAVVASAAEPNESTGEIAAWLRRSPLVGADLNLVRDRTSRRKVDL